MSLTCMGRMGLIFKLDIREYVDGYTALHYACKNNIVSIVKLLCQDNRCTPSVVNKKNRDGDTPLMLAVRWGHLDIV